MCSVLQIVDELLDVKTNPSKPQYPMAAGMDSDIAFLLENCVAETLHRSTVAHSVTGLPQIRSDHDASSCFALHRITQQTKARFHFRFTAGVVRL